MNIKTLLESTGIGALLGVFIIHPLTMVIYWLEFKPSGEIYTSLFDFLLVRMAATFSREMLFMTILFSFIGVCIGFVFWVYHRKLLIKDETIGALTRELENDIPTLISNGESETLEFKSSSRWDYKQHKINKSLESVIIKTIAGFMNYKGGTLLIGVDDNGKSMGLEKDYNTLKRKNSDGYEQFLVGLVASFLGADICTSIRVIFQRYEFEEICRISISPSTRPVYYESGDRTHFFLRAGGGTRDLNVKEATEYIKKHWQK